MYTPDPAGEVVADRDDLEVAASIALYKGGLTFGRAGEEFGRDAVHRSDDWERGQGEAGAGGEDESARGLHWVLRVRGAGVMPRDNPDPTSEVMNPVIRFHRYDE
jgi:hypothetical protein